MTQDQIMQLVDEYATRRIGEGTAKARAAVVAAIEALTKDAELGRVAIKFVDRAGDVADCDPAERICAEFYRAMVAQLETHLQKTKE